jgi:2-oxoglutarate ferredoxin oxidoreductase subunit alpha
MTRELWKGNEAIAEAAVRAGLQAYFGYPITPQTEGIGYLSWRMPELGRAFLQAESELGAINMVTGSLCGARTMTSTSSPGTSLMMEDYRISPVPRSHGTGGCGAWRKGLGNIAPAQGDYNQIVHGGGQWGLPSHRLCTSGIQETVDTVY